MKRTILIGQTITVLLYILVYLIRTFVIWEFQNPFRWLLDIPSYSVYVRASIIFCIFLYNIILYTALIPIFYQLKIKNK